ncbi:aldo/keto reductase [Natronospora cellulosivora (SeqCode)]
MKKIKLKTGDQIPVIGFGTYTLKGADGVKAIEIALNNGYFHIDTAESYQNQIEVGKAIRNSTLDREDIFLTSKVDFNNLAYDDVLKACDETLLELETDYLDLYLIHWPNKKIPMKETFRALEKLASQGKIRNVGVSNFTINHLKEAEKSSDLEIVTNQVEFHPFLNQKELYYYCKEKGIIITAYSPIARGKVFQNRELIRIANKYNKNPAQLTLKWLIEKDIVVIPRSRTPEHIKSNIQLFNDWQLSIDDIEAIDNIEKQQRLINPEWGEFDK